MPVRNGGYVPPEVVICHKPEVVVRRKPRRRAVPVGNPGLLYRALLYDWLEREMAYHGVSPETISDNPEAQQKILSAIRLIRGENSEKREDRDIWPGGYNHMALYSEDMSERLKSRPLGWRA